MDLNKVQLPFRNLRVLDFCAMMAGQISTQVLADYGAQVILIESHAHSRAVRFLSRRPGSGAPNLSSPNLSHHFNKFNTNKMSLTLNLENPAGKELAKKLVKVADVVVDNLRPGVMEKMGLGYENLKKVKPDIIALSLSAMGRGGPHQNFRSLSWNLQSLSGWNYMSGWPDRIPINPTPHSHADHSSSPFHGTFAMLAALCYRARTGKGQFIDLSQFEAAINFTETALFDYLVNGHLPEQEGNHHKYAAPHGIYRCKGEERWCAIAVFNSEEWKSLCKVMESEDLIEDKRFNTLENRLKNVEELDSLVEEWTSNIQAEKVMESLQKGGVAAGVVQNVEDLLTRDPHLKERGHWFKVTHPEAGELILEDWGFRFSKSRRLMERAPLLGEHTDFLLREVLAMSEDEINQLIVDGVLE